MSPLPAYLTGVMAIQVKIVMLYVAMGIAIMMAQILFAIKYKWILLQVYSMSAVIAIEQFKMQVIPRQVQRIDAIIIPIQAKQTAMATHSVAADSAAVDLTVRFKVLKELL